MLVGLKRLHPLVECQGSSVHDSLEVGAVMHTERAAWQGDKLVAGPDFEPRVTSNDVMAVLGRNIKLLSTVFQAIIETRARRSALDFVFIHLGEGTRVDLAGTCREHNGLTLLDVDFKIPGHIKILGVGDATLLVLDILNAIVPMRIEYKTRLVIELHVEGGIPRIHARRNAVGRFLVFTTGHTVFYTQVVGVAESKKRAELQGSLGVSLDQRVTYQDAVFVGDEDLLSFQYHTAHAEGVGGHTLTIILTYILVSIRAEHITIVLVDAQVEGGTVLYHSLVERRQQHMVVVVELGHWDDQQPVLLARVAAHNSRTMISTRLISAQYLLVKRLLQINHQVLVKFQIAHYELML